MLKKVTWIHISDLHFRVDQAYGASVVLGTLLRDVRQRIQQDELYPDFIVVTGDIAYSGKESEYTLARHFFDDLLQVTGLSKDRLFPVPGNHDVDRDRITVGAQSIGNSLTGRERANAVLDTTSDRELMLARFEGYGNFVSDYLDGYLRFDTEHYYYVRTLDLAAQRVAILGLNSAWLCASDADRAKGLLIGERQVRAALERAGETHPTLVLALLHHSFDWLRDFDCRGSAAMLYDNCDFILHGHLHHTATTQVHSPDGVATVLACGACYETRDYPNMYNWVHLDVESGLGTMYLRRYSSERGGFWAPDTLTYRNVPEGNYRFVLANNTNRTVTQDSAQRQKSVPQSPLRRRSGEPSLTAVRGLLLAAFTAFDLRRLLLHSSNPAFHLLAKEFSPQDNLVEVVDRTISFCEARDLLQDLVREVECARPHYYAHYVQQLRKVE